MGDIKGLTKQRWVYVHAKLAVCEEGTQERDWSRTMHDRNVEGLR